MKKENKATLAQRLEENYGITCSCFINEYSSDEAAEILNEYDEYLVGA